MFGDEARISTLLGFYEASMVKARKLIAAYNSEIESAHDPARICLLAARINTEVEALSGLRDRLRALGVSDPSSTRAAKARVEAIERVGSERGSCLGGPMDMD